MEAQIYFRHRHSTLIKEPSDHNGLVKRPKALLGSFPKLFSYFAFYLNYSFGKRDFKIHYYKK